MKEFCDRVFRFVEHGAFFTVKLLRDSGFRLELDELGLGDWFLSSILREDERFSYKKMGGTVIFVRAKAMVSRKELIGWMMEGLRSVPLSGL